MNAAQNRLPFDAPVSIVEKEFLAYSQTVHARELEAEVISRAERLRAAGWKHYGIAAIFEAIRFDRDSRLGPGADGYKLNNNHRSFVARKIMAEHPNLAGFFWIRQQYGRAWRRPPRDTAR